MNTYITAPASTQFAAARASRAELVRTMPELKLRIVTATASLRRSARIGAIPTYRIDANKSLVRL